MSKKCDLEFVNDIYTGESINASFGSVDFVVDLLKEGKPAKDVHLICKDETASNFLEIIPSKEIFKIIYAYKSYKVIGIAQSKREAFAMIPKIYMDFLETTRQ